MSIHTRVVICALLVLAACAPREPQQAPATPSPHASVTLTTTTAPSLAIAPLSADAATTLAGELRCGFETAEGLLLLGAADVGRDAPVAARGMLDGRVVALRGERVGGFDALRRGGSFGGPGLRVTVALELAQPTGHEGSAHDALLTLIPTGEQPRTARGRWTCGP